MLLLLLRLLLMMMITKMMMMVLMAIQGGRMTHARGLLQRMMQPPTGIRIQYVAATAAQAGRQCATIDTADAVASTAAVCGLQMRSQRSCR